jgi:hypothetical protein
MEKWDFVRQNRGGARNVRSKESRRGASVSWISHMRCRVTRLRSFAKRPNYTQWTAKDAGRDDCEWQ